MRDGKKLAVDIHLPPGAGPFPCILVQTPYNRQVARWGLPLGIGIDTASSNYAFAFVDWRGFYGSAAALNGPPNRGEDGYDCVQWIATQAWCDGNIGTWGPSALGRVQYLTAQQDPPNLKCAVPLVAGSQYNYLEYFPGGAARTEYLEQLDVLGFGTSPIVMAHPIKDFFWDYSESTTMYPDEIHVPMLLIGGWYDHNPVVMQELFDSLRLNGDPAVRSEHKLLMGPWAHGGSGAASVGSATQGQLQFPLAAGWSDSLALLFFDYYLRSQANGWQLNPVVTYYEMGSDQWLSSTQFPPAAVTDQTLYLQADRSLQPTAVTAADATVHSFDADPRDPSPTIGGATLRTDLDQGPYDQAPLVESRSDLVSFTSPPFLSGRICGTPRAILSVTTDQLDSDIALRLTDVYPDGRSMLLSEGILRLRFRNSYYSTALMTPGQVVEVEIPFTPLSIDLTGHQLRLDISGNNYPRFDVNLNNGGTLYAAGDSNIAHLSVFTSDVALSRLELPVSAGPIVLGREEVQPAGIQLWPNPAPDLVWLRTAPRTGTGSVQVYAADGRLALTAPLPAGSDPVRVDVAHLPAGFYLVRAVVNGVNWTGKLIRN